MTIFKQIDFGNRARDPKWIQHCQNGMNRPSVEEFFFLKKHSLLEPVHPWQMSLRTRHESQTYGIGMTRDIYVNELFSAPFIHPCVYI